jgi:predicted RNase H-like HicB family nuclease
VSPVLAGSSGSSGGYVTDGYVAFCPDVDVASQGASIDEARANLVEALELFFETASESELKTRLHTEVLVTRLEVAVG